MRCTHLKQVGRISLVLLLASGAAVAGAQSSTNTTLQLVPTTSTGTSTVSVHVSGSGDVTGVVTILAAPTSNPTKTSELGSVVSDSDGNATLVLSANTVAGQLLSAEYRGNSSNSTSTSPQIQAPSASSTGSDYDYLQSATWVTTQAGSAATTVATVTPTGGFTQNVSFFCTGLPLNSQCTFTPSTVQTTGGAVTSTLQILTTSPSGNLASSSAQSRVIAQTTPLFFAVSLALGLLLVSRGKRLQKLRAPILMLMGGMLLLGLSGCNARYNYLNHAPSPANTGTPTGTYSITVTASSDNGITTTDHTVPLVLTVD